MTRRASLAVSLMCLAAAFVGCEGFEAVSANDPAPARAGASAAGLDSANADVRRESALELAKARIADRQKREQVVRRMVVMAQSDTDSLVRSAALQGLLAQDPAVAVDTANRVRADESAMVRWDATKILAARGGKAAAGALVERLTEDPDANVRREAARALGRHDEPRVARALAAALDDPDLSVVQAAYGSLLKISAGVDFGMKREPWEKWWK